MNQLTQQTMTIKELAEVAGCSTKTVRRTIADKYPNLTKNGKVSKLTKEQCFDIIKLLPKRNIIEKDLGQMSKVKETNVQGVESRVDRLESKFDKLIDLMIAKELGKKEEPKQLPPKLEPRDEIRKIINSYCHYTGTTQNVCWNLLYQECYYTLHRNFRLVGQNRTPKVSGLDIAEEEGFIFDILLVARNIFQLGRS